MNAALLELPKEQLVTRVEELEKRIPELEFDLEQARLENEKFRKMIFGQSRERFVPEVPENQLLLALGFEETPAAPPAESAQVTRTLEKKKRKEKPFRGILPDHLRREITVIMPSIDLIGAVRIGVEVTEILECKKAEFYVRRIERPKFIFPKQEERGVVIAELPSQPIDKGIAGPTLLTLVVIDKYLDHLPLNRIQKRIMRSGMKIPASTLCGWVSQTATLLLPLYDLLKKMILASGYIQADETPIKVLDRDHIKNIALGYHWIYQDPVAGLVLFEYRRGRSRAGPVELLRFFNGFLQSDGFCVYEEFDKPLYGAITLVACMAHARRKFHDALSNDPKRANEILTLIQELYMIERKARENGMDHAKRHELRKDDALPILKKIKDWLIENQAQTTPKSAIGAAINYSLARWDKLCNYTLDGRLEIDNNLAENSIRPIAMGRRNFHFAGSHDAAQNAAIIYSLIGTCLRNGVNPAEWLEEILSRIKEHPINRIEELLPHNWKKAQELKNQPAAQA